MIHQTTMIYIEISEQYIYIYMYNTINKQHNKRYNKYIN